MSPLLRRWLPAVLVLLAATLPGALVIAGWGWIGALLWLPLIVTLLMAILGGRDLGRGAALLCDAVPAPGWWREEVGEARTTLLVSERPGVWMWDDGRTLIISVMALDGLDPDEARAVRALLDATRVPLRLQVFAGGPPLAMAAAMPWAIRIWRIADRVWGTWARAWDTGIGHRRRIERAEYALSPRQAAPLASAYSRAALGPDPDIPRTILTGAWAPSMEVAAARASAVRVIATGAPEHIRRQRTVSYTSPVPEDVEVELVDRDEEPGESVALALTGDDAPPGAPETSVPAEDLPGEALLRGNPAIRVLTALALRDGLAELDRMRAQEQADDPWSEADIASDPMPELPLIGDGGYPGEDGDAPGGGAESEEAVDEASVPALAQIEAPPAHPEVLALADMPPPAPDQRIPDDPEPVIEDAEWEPLDEDEDEAPAVDAPPAAVALVAMPLPDFPVAPDAPDGDLPEPDAEDHPVLIVLDEHVEPHPEDLEPAPDPDPEPESASAPPARATWTATIAPEEAELLLIGARRGERVLDVRAATDIMNAMTPVDDMPTGVIGHVA